MKSRTVHIAVTVFALAVFAASVAHGQINVTQRNYDGAQTGWNSSETVLSPSNVNVNSFGKLWTASVDDHLGAQPLYVHGLTVNGATHNVVFAATMNNTVYAFDADTGGQLWSRNFGVPVNHTEVGQACGTYLDFTGNAGLVGTPVIDTSSSTMYFVAHTVNGGAHTQTLHAIDITNGNDRAGAGSVVISGGGFNASLQNQRSGLILLGGTVYIAESSYCDTGGYHGYLFGYTASTLAQRGIFNTSGAGAMDAIWMSGGAPATDGTSIYYLSANGSWNGAGEFGESFLKVNQSLGLVDFFTPDNWSALNGADLDVGSGRGILVPGTNRMIGGGKAATVYVVDTTNMGHLVAGNGQIVQHWAPGGGEIHGSAYANGAWYLWQAGGHLLRYAFNGSTFNTTPTSTSGAAGAHPGGNLTVSSNGGSNGIVWALTADNGTEHSDSTGELRAFDANNVATELYNTNMNAGRDSIGNYPKFTPPTVANGKVYVPTFSGHLIAYGPLVTCSGAPSTPTGLTATAVSNSEIDLSWTASTAPAGCSITYSVSRGGTTIASGVTGTSFKNTGLACNTPFTYTVTATDSAGSSGASNSASATTGSCPVPGTVQINSGGPAVSPFAADEDFVGGTTINHANTIDLSGVTNPAPMAVYQTARVTATAGTGTSFTYTIPGFTAGSSQLVRLHFAETFHTTAGSRVFNVSINGTQVLTNFDIFATAGAANKAVIEQFTENADSSGQYVITFTTVTDKALISGIEVIVGGGCSGAPTTPTGLTATTVSSSQINLSWTASTAPSGCSITYSVTRNSVGIATGVTGTTFNNTGLTCNTAYTYTVTAVDSFGSSGASNSASATTSACPTGPQINSGGPAVSPFVADVDFTGGATINHANTINLNGQTNPAPAAVYQTARVAATIGAGTTFSYTIPGFAAGSSHTVRLHFCETFWTAAGQRVFNVSINGTQVLTNFDVLATAGGQNRALIEQFTENANASGQYVIVFTTVTDKALVSGIEVQ